MIKRVLPTKTNPIFDLVNGKEYTREPTQLLILDSGQRKVRGGTHLCSLSRSCRPGPKK